MDVSGCGFLEADQKAAGFVLTCTPAGATPARRQGRLCDSAASATAPPLRQRRLCDSAAVAPARPALSGLGRP